MQFSREIHAMWVAAMSWSEMIIKAYGNQALFTLKVSQVFRKKP